MIFYLKLFTYLPKTHILCITKYFMYLQSIYMHLNSKIIFDMLKGI